MVEVVVVVVVILSWLLTLAVSKSENLYNERYIATPGEFPYSVVVLNRRSAMFSGILVTDDTVLISCFMLVKSGSKFKNDDFGQVMEHDVLRESNYRVVASNGDWQNDTEKKTRQSGFLVLNSNCSNPQSVGVAGLVVTSSFRVNNYVTPITTKRKMIAGQNIKTDIRLLVSQNKDVPYFVIGGYSCGNISCSKDSPMFRYITKILSDEECHTALSDAKMGSRTAAELGRSGTYCFPTKDVGGPGSPVQYNLVVVAIGIRIIEDSRQQSYLVARKLDIGYNLIRAVYSEAPHFRSSGVLVLLMFMTEI